jgi:predicted amidohydrolase YtcJ
VAGEFDAIFVGGSAFTAGMSSSAPLGVAIRDGRIAAVAPDAQLRDAGAANIVELHGGLVMPAFHDAHAHPIAAGLELLECDLSGTYSAAEAIDAITTFAGEHPEAEWIRGGGWGLAHFPGGTPTAELLDRIPQVAGRPVALMNRDHHGMWVNSEALRRAGIDANTPDPADGRIERTASGAPSGVLHEGAVALVQTLMPTVADSVKAQALAVAESENFRFGIAGWQDAWVGDMPGVGDLFDTYLLAAEHGTLRARVTAALWWERTRGLEQIAELAEKRDRAARLGVPEWFTADTVKVMVDGITENFTAALSVPYLDQHGCATHNRGLTFLDPEQLIETVVTLDEVGFNVHFHALGDRAVTIALDAIERAIDENPPRSDRRHHLAHLQMVQHSDAARFARLGAWANLQMLWANVDEQLEELNFPFIDASLVRRHYPFADLRDAGARFAAGSDWPVSTQNPIAAAHIGVNRAAPGQRIDPRMDASQRLTLADVFTAYTAGSAEINGRAALTGKLEAGLAADLVTLNRDPFAGPPEEIFRAEVHQLLVGGAEVFRAGRQETSGEN